MKHLQRNILSVLVLATLCAQAAAVTYQVQFYAPGVRATSSDLKMLDSGTGLALSSLSFPSADYTATSTASATLKNGGLTTVVFAATPFSVPAPFSVASTTCAGASLAPGASCTVSFNFAPYNATKYTAALTVYSSLKTPALPALTGVGTAPLSAQLFVSALEAVVLRADGVWKGAGLNIGTLYGPTSGAYAGFTATPSLTGFTGAALADYVSSSAKGLFRRADGTWWGAGSGYGNTLVRDVALDGAPTVYLGSNYTLAKMSDGVWRAKGYDSGQFGVNTKGTNYAAFTAIPDLAAAVQVVPSQASIFMKKADGTWWVAGNNSSYYNRGHFGLGDTADRAVYTYIPGIDGATKLVPSTGPTFAQMADGSWKGTGANANGGLGIGDTTDRVTFTAIPSLAGAKDVAAQTELFTVASDGAGNWRGTGYRDSNFQPEGGSTMTFVSMPILNGYARAFATYYNFYAQKTDGTIFSSGSNNSGALAQGVSTTNPSQYLLAAPY